MMTCMYACMHACFLNFYDSNFYDSTTKECMAFVFFFPSFQGIAHLRV